MCRIIEGGSIRLLLGLLLGLLGSSPGVVARTTARSSRYTASTAIAARVSVCVFLLMESIVGDWYDDRRLVAEMPGSCWKNHLGKIDDVPLACKPAPKGVHSRTPRTTGARESSVSSCILSKSTGLSERAGSPRRDGAHAWHRASAAFDATARTPLRTRVVGFRSHVGSRRRRRARVPRPGTGRSWPPSEVKGAAGEARKSWPPAKGEGSPPRAEGTSPVNAYWWTRKVLAENEVDLDDDHDLDDGKSRI